MRNESDGQPQRARSAAILKSEIQAVLIELEDMERKLESAILSLRWARSFLDRMEFVESGATGGARPAESGHSGPAALDPASGEG